MPAHRQPTADHTVVIPKVDCQPSFDESYTTAKLLSVGSFQTWLSPLASGLAKRSGLLDHQKCLQALRSEKYSSRNTQKSLIVDEYLYL